VPGVVGGGEALRSRLVIVLCVSYVLAAFPAAPAVASPRDGAPVFAQDPTGPEDEAEGQEGQGGAGEGQGTAEAETGAGGETTEGTAETGPPWTYQMARISLALLVALALGIAFIYHRLVTKRQRGEA
jgi:hypothetical protein